MDELNNIKQQMHQDSYLSYKGVTQNLKEPFIYIENDIPYIVFIAEKKFLSRAKAEYEYAVFSVKNNCCINKKSADYQKIVRDFPSLSNIDGFNLSPDFENRKTLAMEFEGILQSLMDEQKLTEENRKRYIAYLKTSQKLKKEAVKEIYSYFLATMEGEK